MIRILVLALLAGCATPIPQVPKTVEVPTPIACVDPDKVPARPAFRSENELELLDDYTWSLAVYLERQRAIDYAGELAALVEGCSRIPPAPASS